MIYKILYLIVSLLPLDVLASDNSGNHSFLASVGVSIMAATVLAFLAHKVKQPLILAYIAAGVVIGPEIGFGWVQSQDDIKIIAEMGLILLLFMIGLEMDLKKLQESGKSLITTGISQFILCVAMGFGFFYLLGFTISEQTAFTYAVLSVEIAGGPYDLLYLAVCIGISSTTIVVKLLYEKYEIDTAAGRITIGVLVFQDIWAIVILGIQPNLANPEILAILWSFAKGGILVLISLLISKYVLRIVFSQFANSPELILIASLGWCIAICALAGEFGLSLEMGALIAGAAISTFPYNLDVLAKIISMRDVFLTLFFVSLGMQIPDPLNSLGLVGIALIVSLFLVLTRILSVFPVLYALKNGHRVSLLTTINLSQISEFSLVIAALGLQHQHISHDLLTIIIFTFVITAVVSTYMIQYNYPLQALLSKMVTKLGFQDIQNKTKEESMVIGKEIALLGFHRIASSLVREMEEFDEKLKKKLIVVDFNPEVHFKLEAHNVKMIYGDISHLETLRHAGIESVKVVISSVPDTLLKGTDNLRIIKQIQKICPYSKIVVTAESPSRALKMYAEGADYVLLPRLVVADHLIPVLREILAGESKALKDKEIERLKSREEIIS